MRYLNKSIVAFLLAIFIFSLYWLLLDIILHTVYQSLPLFSNYLIVYLCGMILTSSIYMLLTLCVAFIARKFRLCAILISLVCALVFTCIAFINVYIFRFFGQYLFPSALNFVSLDPIYLLDYLKTYSSVLFVCVFILQIFLFYLLFFKGALQLQRIRPFVLFALIVFIGSLSIVFLYPQNRYTPDIVTYQTIAKYSITREEKLQSLLPTQRVPLINSNQHFYPKTVIVMINESMGLQAYPNLTCSSSAMPFLSSFFNNHADNILFYKYAFASSTATDISMPSIYCSVSPEESYNKLHEVPMVFNVAKKAGYKVIYVSSQRLSWGGLDRFLAKQPIDIKLTQDELGLSVVNDLGVDDMEVFLKFKEFLINQPIDQPLFVFYNTNSLHAPFQTSSKFVKNIYLKDNYERALFLIDNVYAQLFQLLDSTHRLKDAWIISTGDHGESSAPKHAVPRISSSYDEFIRVPLWMYLPQSIVDDRKLMTQIKRNIYLNVSNLDILPSFADVLGFSISAQYQQWSGMSLFKKINEDRLLTILNTNSTRHWDTEGFALIYKQYRYTCHTINKCELFDVNHDNNQIHPLKEINEPRLMNIFKEKIAKDTATLRRIYYKNMLRL